AAPDAHQSMRDRVLPDHQAGARAPPHLDRLPVAPRALGRPLEQPERLSIESGHPPTIALACTLSERLEVLNEVGPLARRQTEPEARVVVVDHRAERPAAPVVVEAALGVS